MAQKRGRKSVNDLTGIRLLPRQDMAVSRLAPPPSLTAPERECWLRTVNSLPAAALAEHHAPLLTAYVQHVVRSMLLASELSRFDPSWLREDGGIDHFDRLSRMAERETRAMAALAVRLRISPSSIDRRTSARQIVNAPRTREPWLPEDGSPRGVADTSD